MKGKIPVIMLIIFLLLFSTVDLSKANNYSATAYKREIKYEDYLKKYRNAVLPDEVTLLSGVDYTNTNMNIKILEDYQGVSGKSVLTTERGKNGEPGYIEWDLYVEKPGLYNISLKYFPVNGRGATIHRDIWINGKRPFAGAKYLSYSRIWSDGEKIVKDEFGNEVRPEQIEKRMWREEYFKDSLGYHQDPYLFYFKKGKNTIRLISQSEPMIIKHLKIHRKEEIKNYNYIEKIYKKNNYQITKDVFIKIQGEDADLRSHSTLFPVSDHGDPKVEPYHPAQIRLNSIGGHRWSRPGQWISWEFEIPEDGLYTIAIKAKQDQQRGLESYRNLKIDGKIPFAELKSIPFHFSNVYQMKLLGKGTVNKPYLFYFEKGKHRLTMEVVLGEITDYIRKIENTLYEMNTIYRRITMITTPTPDPLRDYELEKRIPQIIDKIKEQELVFKKIAKALESKTGQKSENIELLNKVARLLNKMYHQPDKIPELLGEYRDNIGAVGTWLSEVKVQPLQIDYLVICSPGKELPSATPSFTEKLLHEVRAFFASFNHEYKAIGSINRENESEKYSEIEPLEVWIGLGRDQAQSLKQMIEDSFTPETKIPVELKLITNMNTLLIPATIAGTAPDVALGAADMKMAFRGALTDLSKFPDFNKVAKRFKKSAFVPFSFRDAVYALPEKQSFAMLFYRKDILAELGLEIPRTWEDIYKILPVLQKHNMNLGLQPNMGTYLMFLYQKGVPLYKPDMVATNLDSEVAVQTFKEMSELYSIFNLPIEFNIMNRFRMGETPLVITGYSLFNQLKVFAPELRGEWDFTLLPGIRMEDGTISRVCPVTGSNTGSQVQANTTAYSVQGAAAAQSASVQGLAGAATTGAVILKKSDKKEEAWKFLKWWTSAEVQARFGHELESLMGAAARYPTANVKALERLPWSPKQRDVLMEQWDWVEGIPPVPGGYYVTRQFDWLFRAVVLQNKPVRESIQKYNRAANKEITRKREEFGLETTMNEIDENWIKSYWDNYTYLNKLELEKYLLKDDSPELEIDVFELDLKAKEGGN